MDITLGEKMKLVVMRSGYSHRNIKEETGLSAVTLQKIFNNKASMGSWMVLCKFLNVSLDVVINGELNCKE